MLGLSFWEIAVVGVVLVLLFGRGKISALMGDVAKGIKNFKRGMADDEPSIIDKKPVETATPVGDRTTG